MNGRASHFIMQMVIAYSAADGGVMPQNEMNNQNQDLDVFTWLKEASGQDTLYLNPLNLMWSDQGPEHDLSFYSSISERLDANRKYWAQLISENSWRENLVGCVCIIMARPDYLFSELSSRFCRGSFVSPQICMTMGIVYPEQSEPYLSNYISELRACAGKGKQISSAYSVLHKLNIQNNTEPEFVKLEALDQDNAVLAKDIVNSQWEFWASR